jgi:predicted nucleotidyltransferase
MVTSKTELLELLHTHKKDITAFGVCRLGLFGSFLYDRIDDNSDLDLFVAFRTGQKNYTNFSDLAIFLEDLTGRPVELVTKEGLSPYIGPNILREVEDVSIGS